MNPNNPQLEKEIDRLIITLNSVGSSIRNNAVNRLVEIGEPAFKPVVEASQINNSLLRRKTCDVLGLMGDPRAVKPLISLLTDENKYVRRRAANALILVGDERAVKPLCVALNDPEPKVSARAAIALGNIGDESAIPSLVFSLDDWRSEVSVTAGAALNKLGVKGKKARKIHESKKVAEPRSSNNNIVICPGCGEENESIYNFCFSCGSLINVSIQQIEKMEKEKDVDGLIKALNNHNSVYKTETILALSNIDNEKALEAIIAALNDDSWMVRCEAAEVLGKIGNPLAVEPLTKTLDDENSFVICDALDALAEIGDTSAINSIHNMLKNMDEDIRVHAEEALLKIVNNVPNLPKNIQEDVNKILNEKKKKHFMDLTYLLNSPDRNIRNNAVHQLANDPDSFEIVLNVSESADNVRKRGICDIFGLMGDPRAVKPLTQLLDDLDVSVRRKAATALIKVNNDKAVDPLCSALNDSDFKVRLRAVEALGKIGDPRAIDPLIKSSKDSDSVGEESIKALNKIGWKPTNDEKSAFFWIGQKRFDKCIEIGQPAVIPLISTLDNNSETRKNALNAIVQIGEPAVEPLISSINSTNTLIKKTACDVLGIIGDKRAVIPLTELLNKSDKTVRIKATNALSLIGDERAVLPLIETMNDSSFKVRLNSAKALGNIGDPRAIDVLITSSMDSDSEVSEESVKALDKIGWKPGKDERSARFLIGQKQFDKCIEIGEPAIIPLINEFNSDNSETRKNALNALVQIGEPTVEPLISSIDNTNTLIKRTACDALGIIGDKRAVLPLTELLTNSDKTVRIKATDALSLIADERAVLPLIESMNDSEYEVRLLAAEALGKIGDSRGIDVLISSSMDPNRDVSEESVKSLDKIGWKPGNDKRSIKFFIGQKRFDECVEIGEPAINPLINVFNSDDSETRNKAVNAIVKIGKPAIDPLINVLNNPNTHIKRKACETLGLIGDERAVQPLCNALLDSDSGVRVRAATALGNIGDESAIQSLILSLDDSRSAVSQAAKKALKKMGLPGQKAIEKYEEEKAAIKREELIKELDLRYSTKREITSEDFKDIQNKKYVNGLIKVLQGDLVYKNDYDPVIDQIDISLGYSSPDMNVTWPCIAASELANIGDEHAICPLTNLLLNESVNKRIRGSCLHALDKIGTINSYNFIANCLPNLKGDLFRGAVDSFHHYGGGLDVMEKEGDIGGLIKLFSMYDIDRKNPISGYAFGRLQNLHDSGMPVVEHLFKAMDDESYKNSKYCIKCHFVRAIGDLSDKSAIDPLIEIMNTDPEPKVRHWAALSLYKLGYEDIFDSFIEIFNNSTDAYLLSDAAYSLGSSNDQRAIDPLKNCLNSPNIKIRAAAIKALNTMGIKYDGPLEIKKEEYHPENKNNINVNIKSKRFINPYFNVFVPTEWSKYTDPYFNENDDSNNHLKRYNPEVELHATSALLNDGITNLDIYIDDEKTYQVRDREVASEGYIDISGTKGYRVDWISPSPVESFVDSGEAKYHEGTNIIFIKNNRHYSLRFYSDVGSYNESNIFEIRDDINFIITNLQTKSPSIIKND